MKREQKQPDFKFSTVLGLLAVIFLQKGYYLLITLTEYYPFSRIFINQKFHYRFREVHIAQDFIDDMRIFSDLKYFQSQIEMDQYFAHVVVGMYRPDKRKLKKFFKMVKKNIREENVYIQELEPYVYRLDLVRSALKENILWHDQLFKIFFGKNTPRLEA